MGSFVDLAGRIFGDLTVIGRSEYNKQGKPAWHCLCSCGSEAIIRGSNLVSGHTESCGHKKVGLTDISGVKFGKLTPVAWVATADHGAEWFCNCDCGGTVVSRYSDIKTGRTQSCGCLSDGFGRSTQHRGMVGRVIGPFTVTGSRDGELMWPCKCTCGARERVHEADLFGSKEMSCVHDGATEVETDQPIVGARSDLPWSRSALQ